MKIFYKTIYLVAALAFSTPLQLAHAAEEAYILSTALWKTSTINVCWINPLSTNATERMWVQKSIERTWERNSQLKFSSWNTCPATNQKNSIRIKIDDTGPHVKQLGSGIVGHNEGMVLNFTFNQWSNSCRINSLKRRACIESIAVHEFGHALAFAHEQNRPDTPTFSCTDAPQGSNGDIMVGPWDAESVMNYCNTKYNNFGELSTLDASAARTYYKAPKRDANFTFDADFYLSRNPDLMSVYGKNHDAAWNHWITWGIKEGRRASAAFDVRYYLKANPDLTAVYGNDYTAAYNHWVRSGINEGRRSSLEFDVKHYLSLHTDVRNYYGATNYRGAISHFVDLGLKEKRNASANFSVTNYFNRYTDVQNSYQYPKNFSSYTFDALGVYLHWMTIGIPGGRQGA